MMDKIFLDTNIVLDFVQHREGEEYVKWIFDYASSNQWKRLYVSYLSMANLAYVVRRSGLQFIKAAIRDTFNWCNIISSNDMQILEALKSGSPDFEDALQIACAESRNCDVIITRNPEHFRNYTEIPVITPADFVSHCSK